MTWALCLSCGETKFGALCPCPKCEAGSTGDMNLDIAFSDHHMSKSTIGDLGKVIEKIRAVVTDDELSFWTFIRYVSVHHSSILGVDLNPEMAAKCDAVLSQIQLPEIQIEPGRESIGKLGNKTKRWWQFWKR